MILRFGPLGEGRGAVVLYKDLPGVEALCKLMGAQMTGWPQSFGAVSAETACLFVPRYGRDCCRAVGRGLFMAVGDGFP